MQLFILILIILFKGSNGNIKNSAEPLNGNERFEIREPGFGSVCLGELLNSFEELKAASINQLDELKSSSDRLVTRSIWMEKKIHLFGHLKLVQDILEKHRNTSFSNINMINKRKDAAVNDLSKQLVHEVEIVKHLCKRTLDQCATEIENVKLLEKVDETMKNEIAEIQWQLERFRNLAGELESELIGTKKELSVFREENNSLKKNRDKVEEELWAAKIELLDIKNANISSESGYFSPMKRLQTMREAFDKNEKVIKEQKSAISERDVLIRKYEGYCSRLQTVLANRSEYLDQTSENDAKFHTRIKSLEGQLGSAVRQKNEIDHKMHQLANEILLQKKENVTLKNTVASLSSNIEELIIQNESLINKLPLNVQDFDGASNLTSPRSEVGSNIKDKEIQILGDHTVGSGDILKISEFTMNYSEKGNVPSFSGDLPVYGCQSIVCPQLFDDLCRMAKSAESLCFSSKDIISTSLKLTNANQSNFNLNPRGNSHKD